MGSLPTPAPTPAGLRGAPILSRPLFLTSTQDSSQDASQTPGTGASLSFLPGMGEDAGLPWESEPLSRLSSGF